MLPIMMLYSLLDVGGCLRIERHVEIGESQAIKSISVLVTNLKNMLEPSDCILELSYFLIAASNIVKKLVTLWSLNY